MTDTDGPPRAALIAALVLGVVAIGAVLTVAALTRRAQRDAAQQPVAVAAAPAPRATDPACHSLQGALPDQLGDYRRVEIAPPAPEGAAAWRAPSGGDPMVLRCGLDRPADFVQGAPISQVDSVQWFPVSIGDRSTWYTVDRSVYIALTLPSDSGPTPIQQLSEVIGRTLAAVPIDPAPVG